MTEPSDSSPDEKHENIIAVKKKKRLYSSNTRARRIITAGPSQNTDIPIAESELLDFRNRTSPPVHRQEVQAIPIDPQKEIISSEYDASCESLDIKPSEAEPTDISEATFAYAGLRCQESIANDDPQEGLPPTVDAHLSYDSGYLASSDSFSTTDFRAVVARYAQEPDVSQWSQNKNPEIRVHHQIIYDRFPRGQLILPLRAADPSATPPTDVPGVVPCQELVRLRYHEVGQTSSGGSVLESSVSAKQEPEGDPVGRTDSHSDASTSRVGLPFDDDFEAMLITRIQNRIRELGGIGEYDLSDTNGLTPAGRQVKQRFGFLMQDASDEEQPAGAGREMARERGRRRRRRTPDWMLTDAPSDETLPTEATAGASAASFQWEDRPGEGPRPLYSRSPQAESEVSALRDIRAEGGDAFVEAVLWRLQENLRAGHNFLEYRESVGLKDDYEKRKERKDEEPTTTDDDTTDDESSKSSAGRVHFQDKVLVRPLGKDPLLTEYRKPYSKASKQKLSSVKEYSPEPPADDYEASLKDKVEPTAGKPSGSPATATPASKAASTPKPQPGWKKLFCCMGGGKAEEPAPPPAAKAPDPPPPKPAAAPAEPTPPPPPEVKRKRRKVKSLQVKDLDPDIPNDELRMLHMMFDDQMELCKLSDPETEASLDDPSELSDPDSELETPCFSDFLKACGLPDSKIDDYMTYYKANKALSGSGRGDWAGTRLSPDGRPASASSNDDPNWWDKRARERRQDFRRKRREHREYQRQMETQRDLEVESQLRRALETQRELLREREVLRELERTREASKERKEMRMEEEVLEKELLKRLLAELQNEQARSREREQRRVVAKVLEDELITRLQLELAKQREKSEDRKGLRATQRLEEEANTRELNNRIEELRRRIEENKVLRDYERDEEEQRLSLLEELLDKERRRIQVKEAQRLKEQQMEASDRALLTELERQSEDDETRSQKEYEKCSRDLLRKNEEHKAMRSKLTSEVRKRELVKRKLISLRDIEKTNPRLFQLAKVMEDTTGEKGCIRLEYEDDTSSSGILKAEVKSEIEGEEPKEGEAKEHTETEEAKDGEEANSQGATDTASESPGGTEGVEGEAAPEEMVTGDAGDEAVDTKDSDDQNKDDNADVSGSKDADASQAQDAAPGSEAPAAGEGSEFPVGADGSAEAQPAGADAAPASPPTEGTQPAELDATGDKEPAEGNLRFRESGVQVGEEATSGTRSHEPAAGADGQQEKEEPAAETDGQQEGVAKEEQEPATEIVGQQEKQESTAADQPDKQDTAAEDQQPAADQPDQQPGGATVEDQQAAPGATAEDQQAVTAAGEDGRPPEGLDVVQGVVVVTEHQVEPAGDQPAEQAATEATNSEDHSLSTMSGVNDLYDVDTMK